MAKKTKEQQERDAEQRLAEWAARHFYTLEEARAIRDQRRREMEEAIKSLEEMHAFDRELTEKGWLDEHPYAVRDSLAEMTKYQKRIQELAADGFFTNCPQNKKCYVIRSISKLLDLLASIKADLETVK